jgi:RimK family alpha-L-glutamate ligase
MTKLWITRKNAKTDWETQRLLHECKTIGVNADVAITDNIDVIVNKEDRNSIRFNGSKTSLPDVVVTRTGSGTGYFSLAILRQLERCGVMTINNSTSIDIVKDKLHTHQVLHQIGLPIPKTMLVKHPVNVELVAQQIKFPCVIKVLSGSYGLGVHLSQDPQSFKDLMELVHSLNSESHLLIQEYVDHKAGQDLRIIVIGDRCLGAMLRKNNDGGFKANISRGGEALPFNLTTEIESIALQAASTLGLEIAGIDLLFDKNGFKICEANSAPGFFGFEQATGINVAKEIIDYCLSRINTQRK